LPRAFDADAIVVGGGPAGAAAATCIARAGHDVLVVDRHRFPRDKICGDFVGPVALRELHWLGVADVTAIGSGNAVDRAALSVDGERLITYVLPRIDGLSPFGRIIPRVALDDAILGTARRAGARTLEGHAVTALRTDDDGIEVVARGPGGERRLRARVVVGADGSSSTVARSVRGHAAPREDLLVAVRAYFEDVDGPLDRCDLYFTGDSFPGYAWIFPTSAGVANVGVGMVVETFPESTEHMRDLLLRLVRSDRAMRERLGGARIAGKLEGWPLFTYDADLQIVAERVLLVGDAASLINPVNGEGIQYALSSGRWAAETVNACLDDGDCSRERLVSYERRLRRELRDDMLLARLVVRIIANRTLNPLWLSILRSVVERAQRDAAYARATGGVIAGVVPARESIATPILLRTAGVVAAAILRGAQDLMRDGSLADAAARLCAPAIEVACDPHGARAWAGRVRAAALAFASNGEVARVGPQALEV
jgi:geranylgeranyl reductase family protein